MHRLGRDDDAASAGCEPGPGLIRRASHRYAVRLHPSELLSRLNSSYWFVPFNVTLAGIALALVLLYLDTRLSPTLSGGALGVLRPSSPEGARALLSAVIGAMITAISVTFSVTIVALTVAAQHFGPRVLNNFVRQTSAQIVLGTFMATFGYSVLTLGAVRGTEASADVPALAVSGAVLLVMVSIGALIYYVHHISTTLQIGELSAAIVEDLRSALCRMERPASAGAAVDDVVVRDAPPGAAVVLADESGYVQRIDYEAIAREAAARDAQVWIRREPGSFVLADSALALVHPAGACDDELAQAVRNASIVGRDRTVWQDAEFAVKQLVEIALRALSPGVNEPFTAITCIDRLTEGLAFVASVPEPAAAWCDEGGRARVFARAQAFSTLVHAAFDPIRIFAGRNPAIYARLLDGVAELGLLARKPEDQCLLRRQAESIRAAAEGAIGDPGDRGYVDTRYERTLYELEKGPVAPRR